MTITRANPDAETLRSSLARSQPAFDVNQRCEALDDHISTYPTVFPGLVSKFAVQKLLIPH